MAGAPFGNQNKMKWKTPEERQSICNEICEHLKKGYSQDSFPAADWDTVERYIKDFPEDFDNNKIKESLREGRKLMETLGIQGTAGKLKGFNAKSWEFIMQNKYGWKLRNDVTSNEESITLLLDIPTSGITE